MVRKMGRGPGLVGLASAKWYHFLRARLKNQEGWLDRGPRRKGRSELSRLLPAGAVPVRVSEARRRAKVTTKRDEAPVTSPDRLKALADGVFAIVMTLLVLQLGVPVAGGLSGEAGLWRALGRLLPEFLIYVLSFMILGVFWVMHHSIYGVVRIYDTTLVWLNILFLMFVSLIPFSTALVGKNGFMTATAVVYGVNMLLILNLGWANWAFITGKRRLADKSVDVAITRGGNRMGLLYAAVMLASIGMAFFVPVVSFFVYGVIVLAFIISTLMGRGEVAMILPVSKHDGKASRTPHAGGIEP
jgi:uncharacterized membrane protein